MIDFRYRPEIDGLRAIAVTLVLLFHVELAFAGGFIGVDVFFVISGYLITGLIIKDQSRCKFSIMDFWKRRILRIFPAVFAIVLFTLVMGFFVLFPDEYMILGKSAFAQQCFLSNIYFQRNTGYFDGPAELQPLLHTWSLAVEEQFYFAFPFLMMGLNRIGRSATIKAIVFLSIFSLLLSEYMVRIDRSTAFYLLPFRAWEMLIGSLVCFLPTPQEKFDKAMSILSWLSLVVIIGTSMVYTSKTLFPGLAALAPCISSASFIYSNSRKVLGAGHLLASKPMVFIGLISYSLYLWHWPILVFWRQMQIFPLTAADAFGILAISLCVAILSWWFIEKPFRNLARKASFKSVLISNLLLSFFILVSSIAIYKGNGFEWRVPTESLRYAEFRKSKDFIYEITPKQAEQASFPLNGDLNSKSTVLLWGDSHAMALAPGLNSACRKKGFGLYHATHSATPPVLDFVYIFKSGLNSDGPRYNASVLQFVRERKVKLVVLAGVWSWYASQDVFKERLRHTIEMIASTGAHVAVILDVAAQRVDPTSYVSRRTLMGLGLDYRGLPLAQHRNDNKAAEESIRLACRDLPNVHIIDPAGVFLDSDEIWQIRIGDELMYRDPVHLSVEGGMKLEPIFSDFMNSLVSQELSSQE